MSKENLHFDFQSSQVVFFFLLAYFLKEIENVFFVFLMSYRGTHKSLEELDKTVETLACG